MLKTYDYVICGGGLQGCLAVAAIRHYQPDAAVLLIEQNEIAGNHTWSFHHSDIESENVSWLEPLIDHRWNSYQVRFNECERDVAISYCTILSGSLAQKIAEPESLSSGFDIVHDRVESLGLHEVAIAGGTRFSANSVLDCRGLSVEQKSSFRGGFQKFLGLEVELEHPARTSPCLMDDRAPQDDGFRFYYTLPFSDTRWLVEDTRFSNSSDLDYKQTRSSILAYLSDQNVSVRRILREESGCLPMPYSKVLPPSPNAIGFRGGFFHAATGYSMPLAANLAGRIARRPSLELTDVIADFRNRNRFQNRFSRMLNRMLFQLVKPEKRYGIFEKFYRRLSVDTIQRFYAHRFNSMDAVRLITGRPPSGLTPVRFLKSFRGRQCPAFSI
ncbi:MAG: lycopene beta-cyclase CrtY [Planctomycetota bacterium]